MKLRILLTLALLLCATSSVLSAPKQERAIWAARWFVASPEDVDKLVQVAKENHLTAILFQVRGDGMLLYPSKLEPRSDVMANAPAGWDPLADVIQKAHAQGIEVHAWINSFSVWTMRRAPWNPEHMALKHPDWLMRNRSGRNPSTDIGGIYADPGNPEVRKHTRDIFMEVVNNYDVDGVHFDYIRYPGRDFCYCDNCLTQFRQSLGLQSEEEQILASFPNRLTATCLYPEKWSQWRRDQVTTLVRQVYHDVKAVKPDVRVSASTIVWGPYTPFPQTDAYREVLQDWHGWMREGILDFVCPMIYTRSTQLLVDHLVDAERDGGDMPVWAGLGCFVNPPEGTLEQIDAAFGAGAKGVALFAYQQMSNSGATQDQVFKMLREGPFKD